MSLGKAVVNIMANLKPLKRGLMNAKVAVKGMVSSIASGSLRLLRAGLSKISQAAKLAAVAILGIGIASVKAASDAQETANLFKVAMGDMGDSAEEWAKDFAASIGLNETNIKKMMGSFKLMTEGMGFTSKDALKMSEVLVKMAYDFASLQNISPDEAFTKITAGLSGEIEPLKRFGIVINEAALQQAALTNETIKARVASEKTAPRLKNIAGIMVDVSRSSKRAKIELSENEKVMLRYQLLQEKLAYAENDMLNTRNQTANVFRVIREQLKTTAETIGTEFLPMVTKVSVSVRDWLINNQNQIKAWSGVIRDNVQVAINWIGELIELGKGGKWDEVFTRVGDVLARSLEGIIMWFKDVTPKAQDIGRQIGEGFWDSLSQAPIGKGLSKTKSNVQNFANKTVNLGELVTGVTAARYVGSQASRPFSPGGEIAQLSPAADARMQQALSLGFDGTNMDKIVLELRKLNETVADQNLER